MKKPNVGKSLEKNAIYKESKEKLTCNFKTKLRTAH